MRYQLISWKSLLAIALSFLCIESGFAALQTEFDSSHTALGVWDAQAMAATPRWIKVWLMIMASVFLAGIFFIRRHLEARWLLGGFILGLLTSKYVLPAFDILMLSGLVALLHLLFWSPALYLLLKHRPFLAELSAYSIWSGLATACILFSFVFDIRDSVIYLGEYLLPRIL